MSQDQFAKPDATNAALEADETNAVPAVDTLKAWIDPVVTELEISRTAHQPSVGSDGGTGDCQHI